MFRIIDRPDMASAFSVDFKYQLKQIIILLDLCIMLLCQLIVLVAWFVMLCLCYLHILITIRLLSHGIMFC